MSNGPTSPPDDLFNSQRTSPRHQTTKRPENRGRGYDTFFRHYNSSTQRSTSSGVSPGSEADTPFSCSVSDPSLSVCSSKTTVGVHPIGKREQSAPPSASPPSHRRNGRPRTGYPGEISIDSSRNSNIAGTVPERSEFQSYPSSSHEEWGSSTVRHPQPRLDDGASTLTDEFTHDVTAEDVTRRRLESLEQSLAEMQHQETLRRAGELSEFYDDGPSPRPQEPRRREPSSPHPRSLPPGYQIAPRTYLPPPPPPPEYYPSYGLPPRGYYPPLPAYARDFARQFEMLDVRNHSPLPTGGHLMPDEYWAHLRNQSLEFAPPPDYIRQRTAYSQPEFAQGRPHPSEIIYDQDAPPGLMHAQSDFLTSGRARMGPQRTPPSGSRHVNFAQPSAAYHHFPLEDTNVAWSPDRNSSPDLGNRHWSAEFGPPPPPSPPSTKSNEHLEKENALSSRNIPEPSFSRHFTPSPSTFRTRGMDPDAFTPIARPRVRPDPPGDSPKPATGENAGTSRSPVAEVAPEDDQRISSRAAGGTAHVDSPVSKAPERKTADILFQAYRENRDSHPIYPRVGGSGTSHPDNSSRPTRNDTLHAGSGPSSMVQSARVASASNPIVMQQNNAEGEKSEVDNHHGVVATPGAFAVGGDDDSDATIHDDLNSKEGEGLAENSDSTLESLLSVVAQNKLARLSDADRTPVPAPGAVSVPGFWRHRGYFDYSDSDTDDDLASEEAEACESSLENLIVAQVVNETQQEAESRNEIQRLRDQLEAQQQNIPEAEVVRMEPPVEQGGEDQSAPVSPRRKRFGGRLFSRFSRKR